ncbi:helix-turn-helix domain-containing protein [Kribbella sp. NPDC056861]|uniref:helix-turn-helix domain-containing protein n=1 Tax=Kribbella sp. NPDC056861 TaxID=3154857 RepID=UPI00343A2C1F
MLNETELAARLGVSHRTVRRIRAQGRISYSRVGAGTQGSVQFSEDDIAQYLASNRFEVTSPKPVRKPRRKAS